MTTPRLEIDLSKIHHNASLLVNLLGRRGISVSAVTKATMGQPEIAGQLLAAGVSGLADSRIENIQTILSAAIKAPMMLIRSPMIGQAALVVRSADISLNTELDVISELSKAALKMGRTHGVLLMIELGDLREGIMPSDLNKVVRRTLGFPNIVLKGIGTNLACRCGVAPDAANMRELSNLADEIDVVSGLVLPIVSGGNSSNLQWVLGSADTGRINHLRLGDSILLGRDPLNLKPIEGLHTDAFTLVAEVIESKIKGSQPWGKIARTAFGPAIAPTDRGDILQAVLALGRMDTDPDGLTPPSGIEILGSSSDHLIVDSGTKRMSVGTEVAFQLNYSALIQAMASPFVTKKCAHSTGERYQTLEPAGCVA